MINFHNVDCVEFMRTIPDRYYDLAVVDPPYGGGGDRTIVRRGGQWATKYSNDTQTWDYAPTPEYFEELFRVSKNQIIWGGNYFNLPPCRCFLVWDKKNISENFTMSMCEYAWTSFKDRNAKIYRGVPQGNKKYKRFHPTQKPVPLYSWIFNNYAIPKQRVLDTHGGSCSSAVAAYLYGLDMDICEINKNYFDKAKEFFKQTTEGILI